MKKIVSITIVLFGVLLGALPLASAVTIYTEDWGNANTTVRVNGSLNLLGWTGVADSQTAQPYLGVYNGTGANDPFLGLGLPPNVVYFTGLSLSTGAGNFGQTNGAGMFYTTAGAGAGSAGDSAFTSIDPTLYTNLTFNVEVRNAAGNLTNYFAIQVGGSWYVATGNPLPLYNGTYPTFTNWTMVYTNRASVWNNLTMNPSSVTIGSQAGANLSGPITGIGIVELNDTDFAANNNGFNYSKIVINQGLSDFPSSPPTNAAAAVSPQYVYVGGGASFLPSFSGAPTLVYQWQTNGVNVSGARFLGANTTTLTITNAGINDGLWTYSVAVTNFFGKATNGGLTLIVSNVPPGMLYVETFPYVGPNGNLPITGAGWVSAAGASTVAQIYGSLGVGDVFSYSPTPTTNVYYTTVTNDTGLSGLPFTAINPASYPAITFQAGFVPGNAQGQVPGAVSVYWAVAMNGTWYSSAQSVPVVLTSQSPFQNYQLGFDPAATNWNNLTITNTGGIIGGQAASALTGNITGAGLVVVHHDATGASMNFQNFEILTNQFVGTAPSIGLAGRPLEVGVSAGGGASFGVTATGTQPFTYSWTTNGVLVQNGARVSGATSPTLTIANLNSGDNNMQVIAFISNTAGSDESDSVYPATTLTVTNPPVGLIYLEQFPFVGPATGNYPISSVGWVEAVPSAPNALFERGTTQTSSASEGAAFAYLGTPGTTVYYATTTSDTNQSGLPFPNINLASYPSLNFSVDIAPNSPSATNVAAYFAVQLNGTNWYVAASPLLGPNAASNSVYTTYTMAFNSAAANWNNLTVTGSGGLIGSTAAGKLTGVMTGAGLVFVTVGIGGNFNFDNFQITGTGLGGLNVGPLSGGNLNLSWVGNPVVNLQSTTNLTANWQDVPNTLGLYSLPVSINTPQKFFRLVQH